MICHFYIDEITLVSATSCKEPPTFWERKETGHHDGLYRIHHVNWNDHAERHEVIYMLETGSVPMIITCPSCNERHIDEDDFATKPHHTHACQECGMVWRPAKVNTVGVQFLPGYKSGG